MEPSALYDQTSEFEQRNTFLYFVLGLISTATSLIGHLEAEQGQPAPPSTVKDGQTSDADLRDLLR